MNSANDIYHDLIINASAKEVFDAISLPQHLNNWWTLKCSGSPAPAAEYNLYFAPEYDWYGKVTTCDPNRSFHIKMIKSSPDWDPTSFGFDLKKAGQGVRLQFWHKDWLHCNEEFRNSSFCWAMLLNGLKIYLENGVIVPFEKRA